MALTYPDTILWFVQAASLDGSDRTEGSAVAIRLQKIGQPATARTYLLTCCHVVRGTDKAGVKGSGRPLSVIHAWPPDTGFTTGQRRPVRIAAEIEAQPAAELTPAEASNAAEDWVILKLLNDQDATARPGVGEWAGAVLSGDFWVCGYLGSNSFLDDKVLPTRIPGPFPLRRTCPGCLGLTGDGTRPGLSGGGVFGSGGVFAGIHRGRNEATLVLSGVSTTHIRSRLNELGYEPPVGSSWHPTSQRRWRNLSGSSVRS